MIQVWDNNNKAYTVRDIKINSNDSTDIVKIDGNQVFPTEEAEIEPDKDVQDIANYNNIENYCHEVNLYVEPQVQFQIVGNSKGNKSEIEFKNAKILKSQILVLNENISRESLKISFPESSYGGNEIQSINLNNVVIPESATTSLFPDEDPNKDRDVFPLQDTLPGYFNTIQEYRHQYSLTDWNVVRKIQQRFSIFILLNNKFNLDSIKNFEYASIKDQASDYRPEPKVNRLFIGCLNLDGKGNGVVRNKQGHTSITDVGFFYNCAWLNGNKPTQIIFYNMDLESYIFVDAPYGSSSQFPHPNANSNRLELFIHNADKIGAYAFGSDSESFNPTYIKMWMTPGSEYDITNPTVYDIYKVEILEDGFHCKVFGKDGEWDKVPLNEAYFDDYYYGGKDRVQFKGLKDSIWIRKDNK